MALLWFVLVPLAGSFKIRQNWRNFRRRFNELRLKPILDYEAFREAKTGEYRFTGAFESLSEDNTLWIRNDDLTIPVYLEGVQAYLLPDDPDEALPERIRWNRISVLMGEARVYVGGTLTVRDGRHIFASVPDNPLQVILYEGSDQDLTVRTTKSGRYKNKYWNFITPYAHVLGAFSEIGMAIYLFNRPARRLAMITAFIAFFAPLIPLIPPGILFGLLYRRLWWRARLYRVYRDLARLPLAYIPADADRGVLPDGSLYELRRCDTLPEPFYKKEFPFIIPETEKRAHDKWYVFGISDREKDEDFLSAPADPFAVYGALPGEPEALSRRYSRKGWAFEIVSWLVVAAGIGVNLFFIRAVLILTGVFN